MASYLHKLANTVTNSTSGIIGRGNMTKLANSLNQIFTTTKYRDYMKAGNTIQLISKTSRLALQICASQNDPNRLILLGNGQIGPNYMNSQLVIECDKKTNHYKFKNYRNFIAFDQDVPCIIPEPVNPKHNWEKMRTRNEFRIHEVIGSDEYFCLESVYSPGRYLSVTPQGDITVSRNKTDESTQFCLHVIHILPDNYREGLMRESTSLNAIQAPPTTPGAPPTTVPIAPMTSSASTSSGFSTQNPASSKDAEAALYNQNRSSYVPPPSAPAESSAPPQPEIPPTYTSLFPKLPGQ